MPERAPAWASEPDSWTRRADCLPSEDRDRRSADRDRGAGRRGYRPVGLLVRAAGRPSRPTVTPRAKTPKAMMAGWAASRLIRQGRKFGHQVGIRTEEWIPSHRLRRRGLGPGCSRNLSRSRGRGAECGIGRHRRRRGDRCGRLHRLDRRIMRRGTQRDGSKVRQSTVGCSAIRKGGRLRREGWLSDRGRGRGIGLRDAIRHGTTRPTGGHRI